MQRIPLKTWDFRAANRPDSFQYTRGEDAYAPVVVPHDYAVTRPRSSRSRTDTHGGWFEESCCFYRCRLPECGPYAYLSFDGVQGIAEIFINGQKADFHPYPYTGFVTDISPYLKPADNTAEVRVSTLGQPASRWYTGCGLNRAVTLITGDGPYLSDVYVRTDDIFDGGAILRVEAETGQLLPGSASFRLTLLSPGGEIVFDRTIEDAAVPGRLRHTFIVPRPELWTAETPSLYTLTVAVTQNGRSDAVSKQIGIRTVAADHDRGLLINGQSVKLRGGCVHHDAGPLGACAWPDNELRRVSLMKQAGFNAIRCAHNPPSTALLDACDRLGMYVIDEAFDAWRAGKLPADTHLYFAQTFRRSVTEMIVRDRSHPCVVLWSTGNEIPEKWEKGRGYDIEREIVALIRGMDTRPITHALCNYDLNDDQGGMPETEQDELNDILGYNYAHDRVAGDRKAHPRRLFVLTETFPHEAAPSWKAVRDNDFVVGDFVWTGWDYLGEAGIGHWLYGADKTGGHRPWPWFAAWCGDFDLIGHRRPQSFLREIVWGLRDEPCLVTADPDRYDEPFAISAWGFEPVAADYTWPGREGKPIRAYVYSASPEVELFLNGKSLGRKAADDHARAVFEFNYAAGELKAVNTDTGRSCALTTGGCASALSAKCDDMADLIFISIALTDKTGQTVTQQDRPVRIAVDGGELTAFASADPASEESFFETVRTSCEGRLLAVVRKTGKPVRVIVEADGLKGLDLRFDG